MTLNHLLSRTQEKKPNYPSENIFKTALLLRKQALTSIKRSTKQQSNYIFFLSAGLSNHRSQCLIYNR